MGKLEELEKELYEHEEEEALAKRLKGRILLPYTLKKPAIAWEEEQKKTREQAPEMRNMRAIRFYFWSIAVLLSLGAAAFFYFYLGTRGQEVQFMVPFEGTIESGEVITVPFSFKNISEVPLRDAELFVVLPDGTLLIEGNEELRAPTRIVRRVGDVAPGEEKREEIRMRFFGVEGEERKVEATLLYRPENLRARFSARVTKGIFIERVPLAVFVDVPDILASGQETEVTIRYTSHARLAFENMSIRMTYPPGFQFLSSEPKAGVGDTIWHVGRIASGAEGEIKIRGVINGDEGALHTFVAEVGIFNTFTKEWQSYSEGRHETKIAVTPLGVEVLLADRRDAIIDPGAVLSFKARYRNNTASTLKNVSVELILDEVFLGATPEIVRSGQAFLEMATISTTEGGVFNAATRAIIWAPGGTPALRDVGPGKSGVFEFRVSTKQRPIVRSAQEHNLAVRARTKISAADIPSELKGTDLTYEDIVAFKVNSLVLFAIKTVYDSSPIVNIGPVPPQVGKKTTYAVVWELRNFTSDLGQAEVTASLPPNITWEGALSPTDARITYNANAGAVRWQIGTVPAGTGIVSPAMVAAFQVSLTPSEADIGKSPALVKEITLIAKDMFTGREVRIRADDVSTRIADIGSGLAEWSVIK